MCFHIQYDLHMSCRRDFRTESGCQQNRACELHKPPNLALRNANANLPDFSKSLIPDHRPPGGCKAGGLVIDGRFVAGQLVMCGCGRFVAGQLVMAGTAITFVKWPAAGGESLVGEA
jgi:hypothetical protein